MVDEDGPTSIPEDCIRIGNKLYNAGKIESWHPGGKIFIQTFTGQDATETFIMHHRRQFPHEMPKVRDAFVKEDTSIPSSVEEDYTDYLELSERLAKVIPRHQGFATTFCHLKNFFFAVVLIGMESYAHYYRCYNPLLMFCFGSWFVITGVNLGHEGCHGSASRKTWVNLLYRWGWSLSGESTLHWIHSHLGNIYLYLSFHLLCLYSYSEHLTKQK